MNIDQAIEILRFNGIIVSKYESSSKTEDYPIDGLEYKYISFANGYDWYDFSDLLRIVNTHRGADIYSRYLTLPDIVLLAKLIINPTLATLI